jgi:hypothetical protein
MSEKKRMPRSKRVAPRERPPMILQPRDKEILQAVNAHQALLGRQLEALFFASRSTAQYRLQRLFQHEFLDRQFMAAISGGPASSPILYTLGRRGQHILLTEFGISQENIRRFPKKLSWQFIDHLIEINDIRIAVALACQLQGFTLETWLDEPIFRAKPDYVPLKGKNGKEAQKPVYPDGYFCLRVPQGKAHFFLEHDRGTEPRSKFRPQIEVYEAYTKSGLYEARFNTKSLRILIVTTSQERLLNLKEVIKRAGGDRKYWFTTFDQISAATMLTQPIWERIGGSEKVALIG